jgi:hypothetical protein
MQRSFERHSRSKTVSVKSKGPVKQRRECFDERRYDVGNCGKNWLAKAAFSTGKLNQTNFGIDRRIVCPAAENRWSNTGVMKTKQPERRVISAFRTNDGLIGDTHTLHHLANCQPIIGTKVLWGNAFRTDTVVRGVWKRSCNFQRVLMRFKLPPQMRPSVRGKPLYLNVVAEDRGGLLGKGMTCKEL